MVSELRCKKETEDHIFVGIMARVIRKGFKVLGNISTSIKKCLLNITFKLTKGVVDRSFFFALSDTLKDENVWVIDSDASKHMTGECSQLQTLSKGDSSLSIELGDKKSYLVKGIGSTSLELESGGSIHLNNILYVPGSNKNLLSISCLEDKGDRVAFVDGKVLVWGKGSSIYDARVVGIHEGILYRLYTPLSHVLVHLDVNPAELWHRRYGHLHYKIFPSLSQMVNGIPKLKEEHEGTCKGCALGKNVKKPFARSDTKTFGSHTFRCMWTYGSKVSRWASILCNLH